MSKKTLEQRIERLENIQSRKPIFVVKLPKLDAETLTQTKKALENDLKDYHTICYTDGDAKFDDKVEFKFFNAPDATEAKIDEIKKIIEDSIKK